MQGSRGFPTAPHLGTMLALPHSGLQVAPSARKGPCPPPLAFLLSRALADPGAGTERTLHSADVHLLPPGGGEDRAAGWPPEPRRRGHVEEPPGVSLENSQVRRQGILLGQSQGRPGSQFLTWPGGSAGMDVNEEWELFPVFADGNCTDLKLRGKVTRDTVSETPAHLHSPPSALFAGLPQAQGLQGARVLPHPCTSEMDGLPGAAYTDCQRRRPARLSR